MTDARLVAGLRLVLLGLVVLTGRPAAAQQPKEPTGPLDARAFHRPELSFTTAHLPLADVLPLLPNQSGWRAFLDQQSALARSPESVPRVFLDPRSGAASNIMGSFPLVPGNGVGNRLSFSQLSRTVGRSVQRLEPAVVAEAFARFVRDRRAVLGVDLADLGAVSATAVTDELWQVSVPQVVKGVPVRYARLVGTISHGNLVTAGTESWDAVRLDTTPRLKGEEALTAGFAFADGRSPTDELLSGPTLEIVPTAPPEQAAGDAFAGAVGSGYAHRLVWSFVFRRVPEAARWEVLVDAQSGEILSFQDLNQYGEVKGGAYPITSTDQCPDRARCGTVQPGSPMPFADTGLPAPDNFTNSSGVFAGSSNPTTTLNGRFVRVSDICGPVNETGTNGVLDMGGATGQHDCVSPGSSAGNTASARSSFYELNRIAEVARGWLPNNSWARSPLTTVVNIDNVCNAFWTGDSVQFFKSGGGCRNTGELAAVFDHEWGHGLDDNDSNGSLSNSSEAYADIAAIYRLGTSCVGYGFFWTLDRGCGRTADGTGFNVNESQVGRHCALECSGVRDADWTRHEDGQPDTALGYVCTHCASGPGPCGRQVHCAAAPVRQAAWDLVTRDLQAAPFGLDPQSALLVGNKVFYQGSGNVGSWHACSCGSSSSGCGATNGYMQWLAADDDNGNLNDGTPHMTAIHAAFNRHGIACANPTPRNGGCAGGPTAAPSLTVTASDAEAHLSWTPVAGASRYWVLRSDGEGACELGKAIVAEVTGTSFTDGGLLNGRQYCYSVVAVGASSACYSRASKCACTTPTACETNGSIANSASFVPRLAPESIVAAFADPNTNPFADRTEGASTTCDKVLADRSVSVRDRDGVLREACLFYVSPSQINLQVPPGTASGPDDAPADAIVTNVNTGRCVAVRRAPMNAVVPGIYSATADGKGLAAGQVLQIRNGVQTLVSLQNPVDLSLGDENFLILYGTGIRLRESQSQVTVSVGGETCEVTYASSQGGFTGLDQVNCRLSDNLRGRSGTVEIHVRVDSPQAVVKDGNFVTMVLK